MGVHQGRSRGGASALGAAVLLAITIALAAPAQAAPVTQDVAFSASDGVRLHAAVAGEGSLAPRPAIVEFSPYAPGCCASYGGPAFNHVQVHIRGTGRSGGRFDALGKRTQADIAEFLGWACRQPWSNGRLGLYGASASAIAVYNSLDRELPCVETAVLWAGTHELYRDLMYPGGIPNAIPAAGVLGLIGGAYVGALPDRLAADPASLPDGALGLLDTVGAYPNHPTADGWWHERSLKGDANDLPILMVTGFFDVESRGPFEAFRDLRDDGAHLYVVGAHDGVPEGSGGAGREQGLWYDRYLRDQDNGVEDHPRVQLWLADGDREDMLDGRFVRRDGSDWPLPGTAWQPLKFSARGRLTPRGTPPGATRSYVTLPSLPTASDPHTWSLLAAFGTPEFSGNALARAIPALSEMNLAQTLALNFTTAPLREDVTLAGPASLEIELASSHSETDIYALISDLWPDGTAHAVATGRLRSAFPRIDAARSRKDPVSGDIVQPYARFDRREPAAAGAFRRYQVELWPIGNRFRGGHRVRLHVLGASAFHLPGVPAINRVRTGGSRLLLPVAPGSDLAEALP